ncbi:MAG: GNAT family N-acetyltransferase [Candidatus Bathyarchaeia archaeon]|nr:GNAT family N-acetyltransferase [Candidatus Bathyarchaeota archaeon]
MSVIKDLGEYVLREATLEDIQVLVRHRRLMFMEAIGARDEKALDSMDRAYERYVRRAMPAGNFKAWLIETKDGEVASGGGISIYEQPPRPQDDTLRYIYIHSVYTEPDHRRRGLARIILETILEWCRANGFKTLTLHAVDASRHLYESMGFKPTTEMRMFL